VKRYPLAVPALLAAVAVLAVGVAPVRAEVRPVGALANLAGLQSYFATLSVPENINVGSAQEPDAQAWRSTISGNSAMTLMVEMAVNANGNSIGIYNAGGGSPPARFEIFPGNAVAGQFAMASFIPNSDQLVVALFNSTGGLVNLVTHSGVTKTYFGYYIKHGVDAVRYSEDSRNPEQLAHMLVFKGTGFNSGNWWLCFEDGATPENVNDPRDFDDAIIFVESINPTTSVTRTSWGSLKSRFR